MRNDDYKRETLAGCDAPLRLAAGRGGCEHCGAEIGAMGTRSIAGDADGEELSALVWRATGCVEGLYPPEELGLASNHPVRRLGTPALLQGLWGGAQVAAGDGGLRLHEREIAEVHEALVAAWRMQCDGPGSGQGFLPKGGVVRIGAGTVTLGAATVSPYSRTPTVRSWR